MFETKLAKDIRRKLSSINPNLKVEPLLLTKAYLSHRVKAKLKSFFDQDLYVLKDYLINEFFNDRNRIVHHFSSEIDMFCAYRNLKTDGSFLADGYTCFPDAIAGKRGTKIPGSEKRVPVMYSNPDMQFFTGTRNNEVCGMNYGDIRDDMYSDRSWHSVLITRSTKLKSSETKLGGKTRNAIRVIHLFEFIFDRLMQRKAHIQKLIDSGQIILPDGTNSINDLPIANAVIKNGQQISNDYTGRLSSVDLSLYGRSFFDNRVEASKSGILAEVLMIMNNNNVYAEELNPTTYLLRRNFATRMHNLSLSDSDQLYILGHAIEDEKESRNTLSNRDALERMYSAFLKHPYYTVVKKLTSGTEMEEAGSPSAVVAVRSREKAANTVKISLDEPYEKIDIVFKDSIQNCKAVLSSQINHTVSEKVDVTRPVNEAYFAKTKR